MAVILKLDWPAKGAGIIRVGLEPACLAPGLLVVLDEDTVQEDGEPGRLDKPAAVVEARPAEGDVVNLPLAGRAGCVEEGGYWP